MSINTKCFQYSESCNKQFNFHTLYYLVEQKDTGACLFSLGIFMVREEIGDTYVSIRLCFSCLQWKFSPQDIIVSEQLNPLFDLKLVRSSWPFSVTYHCRGYHITALLTFAHDLSTSQTITHTLLLRR